MCAIHPSAVHSFLGYAADLGASLLYLSKLLGSAAERCVVIMEQLNLIM